MVATMQAITRGKGRYHPFEGTMALFREWERLAPTMELLDSRIENVLEGYRNYARTCGRSGTSYLRPRDNRLTDGLAAVRVLPIVWAYRAPPGASTQENNDAFSELIRSDAELTHMNEAVRGAITFAWVLWYLHCMSWETVSGPVSIRDVDCALPIIERHRRSHRLSSLDLRAGILEAKPAGSTVATLVGTAIGLLTPLDQAAALFMELVGHVMTFAGGTVETRAFALLRKNVVPFLNVVHKKTD